MDRRVSILVLYVELVHCEPSEKIDERDLGRLEAGPVQRCRSSLVFCYEAHTLLLEEEEADGFVTLCCNVHDIEPIEVLRKHVSAIVEQLGAHIDVAAERRIVQSRELVLIRLQIDPRSNLLRCHLLFGTLHNGLESAHLVLEHSHVNESEAVLIYKVADADLLGHVVDRADALLNTLHNLVGFGCY